MKKMKKIMAFLLATCMVIGMMSTVSFAGPATMSTATGTFEDAHQLVKDGGTILMEIPAGAIHYVQVDDNDNTVATVFTTEAMTWRVKYGTGDFMAPENADDLEKSFTMSAQGYDFFTIENTSTTDSIYVMANLATGSASANDGSSIDKAVEFVFPENPPYMGGGIANENWGNAEVAEGSQGFFYAITALADGYVSVRIESAEDAECNEIGWTYSLSNVTKSTSTDTHWSDEEPAIDYDNIAVEEGDKVILFVNTYDPENEFMAPAGTVYFTAFWGATGTEYGAEVLDEGTETVNGLENEYDYIDPYFVEYVAKEAGSLIFTVSGENGWFYTYDYTSFYSDDEEPVDTWTVELKAGERVKVGLAAYDPDEGFTDADVQITFTFVAAADMEEVSVTEDEIKEIKKDAIISGALFGKEFAISQIEAKDVLALKELEETTLKDLVYEALDLTLWGESVTEDGEEYWGKVQPTAPITITMSLVEELKDAELIEVSRLEDGALVSLGEYEVEDGKITISLDHFSTFVFADVTPEEITEGTETDVTPTGDTTTVLPFIVLAAAALAVLVVLKKKEVTE